MSKRKAIPEPASAIAEHGEVLVHGPNGIAFSLTPDAATRSAEAIASAASMARGQTKPRR